jgi:hypothetical protein
MSPQCPWCNARANDGGMECATRLTPAATPQPQEVPPPCKPDFVHPLRDCTAISLTPPERSALLAQSATNTRR